MSTTLLENLIVSLTLDGSGFKKGADAALVQNKRIKDDAGETAKALSEHGKTGAEFFGKLSKGALEFFAVMAFGKSVSEQFNKFTTTGTALDFLSKNTGTTVAKASALANGLTAMGLNADAAAQSLTSLAQQQAALLSGQPQDAVGLSLMSRYAGVNAFNGRTPVDTSTLLTELAPYFQKLSGPEAQLRGAQFGLSPDLITALQTWGAAGAAKVLSTDASQTQKTADAASKVTQSFGQLEIATDSLDNAIFSHVSPAIVTFANALTDVVNFIHGAGIFLDTPTTPAPRAHPGPATGISRPGLGFPAPDSGFFYTSENNNPGNLRYVGQAGAQAGPNGIAVFDTPQEGVAALAEQLRLYGQRGLNTVSEIVTRYEGGTDPTDTGAGNPDHNNIAAYINFVSSRLGVGANSPLDMTSAATISGLSSAISIQEGTASAKYHFPPPMLAFHSSDLNALRYQSRERDLPASVTNILGKLRGENKVNIENINVNTPSNNPKTHGAVVGKAIRDSMIRDANTGLF